MNLSIKILGFEIASAELDFSHDPSAVAVKTPHVSRLTKMVSRLWVKGMTA